MRDGRRACLRKYLVMVVSHIWRSRHHRRHLYLEYARLTLERDEMLQKSNFSSKVKIFCQVDRRYLLPSAQCLSHVRYRLKNCHATQIGLSFARKSGLAHTPPSFAHAYIHKEVNIQRRNGASMGLLCGPQPLWQQWPQIIRPPIYTWHAQKATHSSTRITISHDPEPTKVIK